MDTFTPSSRNKVRRIPKRGHYDRETIYEVLDAGFLCHVGFSMDDQPFVIPMAYGRIEDRIYLHGATTSRLIEQLSKGINVCVEVTHLDGLVIARSAFHHSINYRSAVVFGKAYLAEGVEKLKALEAISEYILKDRWQEARPPNAKELKATSVLAVKIEEGSAKIRTGQPVDDKVDYELPIWAGVVPIEQVYGEPESDPLLIKNLPTADSVKALGRK